MKLLALTITLWIFSLVNVSADIIGTESRKIISNDPKTNEARLAEAIGVAVICKKSAGNLSLVRYRGTHYLLGAAHSFYANGTTKCDESTGIFAPDFHYRNNENIRFSKVYRFKLPPLNHKTALKNFPKNQLGNNISIRDMVILELVDNSILTNQLGKKRSFLKILDIKKEELLEKSELANIKFIANHKNFHDHRLTSYQEFCVINSIKKGSLLLAHLCDTGAIASGAPLFVELRDNASIIGLHIAGAKYNNLFIPSEYIIEEFKRTIKD